MHEYKWYNSGNTDEKGMGRKERQGREWNRIERKEQKGRNRKKREGIGRE